MSDGVREGFLGLGSNQGDREAHLRAALAALPDRGVEVLATSSLYETAPVGEFAGPQPDYLNLVARVRTELEPDQLLAVCKRLEIERGRDLSGPRHGPRPLDLDLLTLGDLELEGPDLVIPHPALTGRRFVLEPLLELDPGARLPDGTVLAAALAGLDPGGVRRLR